MDSVKCLLANKFVKETNNAPHIIYSPLSVAENYAGKKVKFDDWKCFRHFRKSGFKYMFKFDLKSEYHHIEVNENFSTAMFLFKRIARPLLKYWHKHLIKMACFLEDGLSMPEPFSEATCNSNFVQETLQKSGSLLHSEKSAWEPQELIT